MMATTTLSGNFQKIGGTSIFWDQIHLCEKFRAKTKKNFHNILAKLNKISGKLSVTAFGINVFQKLQRFSVIQSWVQYPFLRASTVLNGP